jgi:hypothetical protein
MSAMSALLSLAVSPAARTNLVEGLQWNEGT